VIGSQTEDAVVGDRTFVLIEASACVACTGGQYSSDVSGGADCVDCVAGTYIDVTGSDELSDCIGCVVGKYIDARMLLQHCRSLKTTLNSIFKVSIIIRPLTRRAPLPQPFPLGSPLFSNP
jgi:hypothetical protein